MRVVSTSLLVTLWLHLIYAAPVPLLQQSIDSADPLLKRHAGSSEREADDSSQPVARDASASLSTPNVRTTRLVGRDADVVLEKRLGGLFRTASFGRKGAAATGHGTTQLSDTIAQQSLARFGSSGKGLKRAFGAAMFTAAAAGTYIGLKGRDKKKKQKKLEKEQKTKTSLPLTQPQPSTQSVGTPKKHGGLFGFKRRDVEDKLDYSQDDAAHLEKRLSFSSARTVLAKLGSKAAPAAKATKGWKKTAAGLTLFAGGLGGAWYGTYAWAKASDKKNQAKARAKYEADKAAWEALQRKVNAPARRDAVEESEGVLARRMDGQETSIEARLTNDSEAHLEKRLAGIAATGRAFLNLSKANKGRSAMLAEDRDPTGWKTKATATVLGVGLIGGTTYGLYEGLHHLSETARKEAEREKARSTQLAPPPHRRSLSESETSVDVVSAREDTASDTRDGADSIILSKRRLPSLFRFGKSGTSIFGLGRSSSLAGSRLAADGTKVKSTSSRWGSKAKMAAYIGGGVMTGYGIYRIDKSLTNKPEKQKLKKDLKDLKQRSLLPAPTQGGQELQARQSAQAMSAEQIEHSQIVKRGIDADADADAVPAHGRAQTTADDAPKRERSALGGMKGTGNASSSLGNATTVARRADDNAAWNRNTRPRKKLRPLSPTETVPALKYDGVVHGKFEPAPPGQKPLKSSLRDRRGVGNLVIDTENKSKGTAESIASGRRSSSNGVTWDLPHDAPTTSRSEIHEIAPASPVDELAQARDRRDRLREFQFREYEKYSKHPGVVYQFDAYGKVTRKFLGEGGKWPEPKLLGIKRPYAIGIGAVAALGLGGALIGVGSSRKVQRRSLALPPGQLAKREAWPTRKTSPRRTPRSHSRCSYRTGSFAGACARRSKTDSLFVVQKRGLSSRSTAPQIVLSKDVRTNLFRRVAQSEEEFVTAPTSLHNTPPSSPARVPDIAHRAAYRSMLRQAADITSTQTRPARYSRKRGTTRWVLPAKPSQEADFVFSAKALPTAENYGKRRGRRATSVRSAGMNQRVSPNVQTGYVAPAKSEAAAWMPKKLETVHPVTQASEPSPKPKLDKGKAPMEVPMESPPSPHIPPHSPDIATATPSLPRPTAFAAQDSSSSGKTGSGTTRLAEEAGVGVGAPSPRPRRPRSPDEWDRWMQANKPYMTKEEYDRIRPRRHWKAQVGKAALATGILGIIGYGGWDLQRLASSNKSQSG